MLSRHGPPNLISGKSGHLLDWRPSSRGLEGPMYGFGAFGESAYGDLPDDLAFERRQATVVLESIIATDRKTSEGVLIQATGAVWLEIAKRLGDDWSIALQIPPDKWEEIVAGAFKKFGYDEVTLTPRSADHGRDVIAVKSGVGSIRILGSVKAYKPGHLVTKEQVHALAGVVSLDPNASKGLLATTSDFAPRLMDDVRLKEATPHRIELMNGAQLQNWLRELSKL